MARATLAQIGRNIERLASNATFARPVMFGTTLLPAIPHGDFGRHHTGNSIIQKAVPSSVIMVSLAGKASCKRFRHLLKTQVLGPMCYQEIL